MTHTSVPWMYFRNFRGNLCICKNPVNISTNSRTNLSPSATNNDYEWVAELWAQSSTSPTAEANAAFIVRACNSHDELLEALEEAKSAIESLSDEALGRHPEIGYPYKDELLNHINTTIAKAKGE